jgi:hypothetical protein
MSYYYDDTDDDGADTSIRMGELDDIKKPSSSPRRKTNSDDVLGVAIVVGLTALTVGLIFGAAVSTDAAYSEGLTKGYNYGKGSGSEAGYAEGFVKGAETVNQYGWEATKAIGTIASGALHSGQESVKSAVFTACAKAAEAQLPNALEAVVETTKKAA